MDDLDDLRHRVDNTLDDGSEATLHPITAIPSPLSQSRPHWPMVVAMHFNLMPRVAAAILEILYMIPALGNGKLPWA